MKKIFTIMFATMAAISASAMSITYSQSGQTIPVAGDEANIVVKDWDADLEEYGLEGTIALDLDERSSLTVNIYRDYDLESGAEDQFCLGNCYNSDGKEKQTLTLKSLGETNVFTAHFNGVEGTISYEFVSSKQTVRLNVTYEGRPQAIQHVTTSEARQGVYTIFGQFLRADNSTIGLPAGMYIVGGKKTIVK